MKAWLQRFVGGRKSPASIVIVSGLPRSGTSMMMRMLEAGGIPPLTDSLRIADPDNPEGYYEFERVKQLDKGDTAWLADTQGKAIKIISALLRHLPSTYSYKVIFVERHMAEVLASQRKMLARRAAHAAQLSGAEKNDTTVDDAEMTKLFAQHLQETRQWLAQQANFAVLYVHYSDLLRDPATQAAQINQFLGGGLDVSKMADVVDPALYRNRA